MIIIEILTEVKICKSEINELKENSTCSCKSTIIPEEIQKKDIKLKENSVKNNSIIKITENKKNDLTDIGILNKEGVKEKENIMNNFNYQMNSSFEVKDTKTINIGNNIMDNHLNLKDEVKINKNTNLSDSITYNEIEEEISNIFKNDIHDIKDLSFKIKNIENLVAGTSVKVNKIIEDFQDDSYIIDKDKVHCLNASFTVGSLPNMNKNEEDLIIDRCERPYHSFIISSNNSSFVLQLTNTSIEKIKSDHINTDDQLLYDPSEPILLNISHINDEENDQEFSECGSHVLSQTKEQINNTKEQKSENFNIINSENSNRRYSLTSPHSLKHSSKKKAKKGNIYRNEIDKTPKNQHHQDLPISNYLPIVGGDINGKGSSIMILTPIRAKKKDREGN